MRKHSVSLALAVILIPVLAGASFAQTPEEIIEKHLTALGGRAALAKITTRKSVGTITVSIPTGELTGPVEMYGKAPNKARANIRVDLSAVGAAGEMVMEQIFDGQAAWISNSMQGDTQITGNQLDNMKNNMFPTPLLAKDLGKLELLPASTINGRKVLVIKATPKAGSPTTMSFDAETFLMVRSFAIVDNPMTGPLEQTTDFSDYRTVDGIKVAFQFANSNAQQNVTFKFTKIEHNIPVDDAIFVKK
jgi:outer membrane lipoprotein-sorting protein